MLPPSNNEASNRNRFRKAFLGAEIRTPVVRTTKDGRQIAIRPVAAMA
jgi:hypothetical protein